jgi:hypothetical protein
MTAGRRGTWLHAAENYFKIQNVPGMRFCNAEDAMWRCLLRWASGLERLEGDYDEV